MTSQEIRTLTDQYIMHTYGRFPVAIDHGEGARLYDCLLYTSYTVVGQLVAACGQKGKTLEELTLEELREVSDLFESDVYDALNLENCMALRGSYGGPAVSETKRQIEEITAFIKARSK